MQAPFPYFGGKSKVVHVVWKSLGEVKRYIEPFFGSGSVLLNSPYIPKSEIVCDKDGHLANVWRAIQYSPDEVAKWCDWPTNHADLIARRNLLLKEEEGLLENLCRDDMWHDSKLAGYWVWCASNWIGSGMLGGSRGKIPHLTSNNGVNSSRGKRPHLTSNKGVNSSRGKIPRLTDNSCVVSEDSEGIYSWMKALSSRLRDVKVVCGDWTRVCGGNWQDKGGVPVGIFFDPPYSDVGRHVGVYRHDCTSVAKDVVKWALPRGEKQSHRIVIAGYEGEHPELEAAGWRKHAWKAQGGYGSQGGPDSRGFKNKEKERLWFSPYCVDQRNDDCLKLGS